MLEQIYCDDVSRVTSPLQRPDNYRSLQIPVQDLKDTIMMIDPEIRPAVMFKYLGTAYQCASEATDNAEPVAIETVIDRLKRGGVYRVGSRI